MHRGISIWEYTLLKVWMKFIHPGHDELAHGYSLLRMIKINKASTHFENMGYVG